MRNIKKIGFGAGITTCIVSLMVILGSTGYTPQSEQRWQTVQILSALGAENNPGTGASGFLEIFFINHSTNPSNAYLQNTSATLESWCVANMAGKTPYGTADAFDVELDSEVSFDIVVRVRFNKTHAWETDHFVDTDCDVQITTSCTGWADGENDANTSANNSVVSRNNTGDSYIWMNFVWNADDNNGYQLADDGVLTISEIYIEARY